MVETDTETRGPGSPLIRVGRWLTWERLCLFGIVAWLIALTCLGKIGLERLHQRFGEDVAHTEMADRTIIDAGKRIGVLEKQVADLKKAKPDMDDQRLADAETRVAVLEEKIAALQAKKPMR